MLKLRVPFLPGETAASFCSRLAFRNRCESMAEFCLDLDIDVRDVITGATDALTTLARLGDIDLDVLTASTIRSEGLQYQAGGCTVDLALKRPIDKLMVCPACLSADLTRWPDHGRAAVAGRTAWMLNPIMTCIEHERALVIIGEVRMANSWRGRSDGHDFTRRIAGYLGDIDARMIDATVRPPTELERHLAARLTGMAKPVNPMMDALPFYAVAHASLALGAFNMTGPKVVLKNLSDEDRRMAGEIGFGILAAGHDAMETNLRDNMDKWPKGKNAATAGAFFGMLHTWLNNRRTDQSYDFMRHAVAKLMFSTRAHRAGDTIYGLSPGSRLLGSVRTIALEMDMHPQRLQRVLARIGVIPPSARRRTANLAVFAETPETRATLEKIKRCIPKIAAQTYINASRIQFNVLLDAGLISPFTKANGGLKSFGFDPLDLDAFLNRLLTKVHEKPPANNSLMPITLAAKQCRTSTETVVRLILDGRLNHLYQVPGSSGFLSVLASPSEIRSVLGWRRPGLSVQDAAGQLKSSSSVIKALITHGHLPVSSVINPYNNQRQHVIEKVDLIAFGRAYVTLYALARKHHRSLGDIKRELQELGVRPAFDPTTVQAIWYRRADLIGVDPI